MIAALLVLLVGCHRQRRELVIFHAASLTQPLGDAAELFKRHNPSIAVRLEPSGSQVAVRKLTDYGMRADVIAVADAALIDKMLVPAYTGHNLTFATGEMVIAHKDHSRFTDEITTENWQRVLVRPGVRIARANPDTAPLGYRTLIVWKLAEQAGNAGLTAKLVAQCAPEHVAADEMDVLALLESRAVDYVFLYRSTAEDHRLKTTALPPELNLSRSALNDRYAQAEVEVRMDQGVSHSLIHGEAIAYSLSILDRAKEPDAARRFVALLLSDDGRKILERRGFSPMTPASCHPCNGIPAELGALVSSAP